MAFVVFVLQVRNIANLGALQQITYSFIGLRIRVNRPVIRLDGRNIICVCVLVFYDIVPFFSKLFVYNNIAQVDNARIQLETKKIESS